MVVPSSMRRKTATYGVFALVFLGLLALLDSSSHISSDRPLSSRYDWSTYFSSSPSSADYTSLPNDGALHLEHAAGWHGHWDPSVLDNLTHDTPHWNGDYSHAPQYGYTQLSAEERIETVERLRNLIDNYPIDWPYDAWHKARNVTLVILERLADCIESNTCKEGETTVVIGGTPHFGNVLHGANSGENIWARSTMDAVETLGHTLLYTYDPLETLAIYQAIPSLVSTILMEATHVQRCAEFGVPRPLRLKDYEDQYGVTALDLEETNKVREMLGLDYLTKKEFEADALTEKDRDMEEEIQWGWHNLFGQDIQTTEPMCSKRIGAEDGIPLWKMFSFHFWPGPSHPLGGGWTVSPEDYHNHPGGSRHNTHNFYLGYSIEKYCKAHTYVDKNERKNRAFVFAKQVSYFDESHFVFWNNDRTFADMKEKLHIDFLAVAGNAKDKLEDPGLTNIGRQPMDQFYEEVANSKLMVGTGSPWLSPTPYDGLCLGLPFINPINGFNRNDPDDREEWNCQHNGLWAMEPPYVYMVHREDIKGLEDAIRQAKNNPIDSYTPPHMTIESNTLRHKNLINLNWRNLALVREQELREVAERKDYLKLFLV